MCVCEGEMNRFSMVVRKEVLNHCSTNSLPSGHYGLECVKAGIRNYKNKGAENVHQFQSAYIH